MSDPLYTQKEFAQFRGPTTSYDYNTHMENLYKDLVYLSNKVGLTEEDVLRSFQREIKESQSLAKVLEDLEERVETLESAENRISFRHDTQVDNDRFDGTDYEITSVNRCFHDSQHGLVTLPKVESSSVSKLVFTNADGTSILPSTFESFAVGNTATADGPGATIDTSDVYNAVLNEVGKFWERNVIVDTPHGSGSEVYLYVRFPTDAAVTADTNNIVIHPYPTLGVELTEISYTTSVNVALNDNDVYRPINVNAFYSGDPEAVGWVPPGGWSGDSVVDCGPRSFVFDPKPITGLRLKLQQNNYFREGSKYLYTYGLSRLDARFEKFLDTGKAIIRFDAPGVTTISSISDITAEIFNVSEAESEYSFEYRVIWETSFDSGVYTTTPVPLSNRVWIEVTLDKTVNGGSPALSNLSIQYT